ncbi:MAG: ATP-binding cassette domain-containing protein [Brevinematales bacterium]
MTLCEDLTKCFGEKVVFEHFSLTIQPGINAILGPSGCGKTTLLRLVAGLDTPDEGLVHVVQPVGMVFPDLRLVEWLSVLDNIRLVSPHISLERIQYTLQILEIENTSKRIAQLSSGQKQRIALARAWLFESKWLLLDEAFRSWDIGLKQRLFPLLRDFWRKDKEYTLLITHDIMEALMIADHLVIFSFPPVRPLENIPLSLEENERKNLSHEHPLFQSIRKAITHHFDPMNFMTTSQR